MTPPVVPWGLDAKIDEWMRKQTALEFYCQAPEHNDSDGTTQEPTSNGKQASTSETNNWINDWKPPTDGIVWLADNVDTLEGLVRRKFYKDYKAAQRAVSKAVKEGGIQCIGTKKTKKGRRPEAYCGSPSSCLQHDLLGTEFRGAYSDVYCERGAKLLHGCDLIFHFTNERRGFVEIDTGTMTLNSKQRDRWHQYEDAQGVVLVVTKSLKRMKNLQEISEEIGDFSLFGVLDEVIKNSWGECYENIDGVAMSVEQVWK